AAATNSTPVANPVPATNVISVAVNNATSNAVASAAAPVVPLSGAALETPSIQNANTERSSPTPANAVTFSDHALLDAPKTPAANLVVWCLGAAAGGAFVVLLIVGIIVVRARRREPSLISQALARERIQAEVPN